MKVADPASYGGVDFVHYPFERFCRPRSSREFGHSVFDRLQGFLRWLNMGIMVPCSSAFRRPDAESEEVELLFEDIDDFCLCLVQGQLQPLQYLPQHSHGLLGLTSPAED